MKAHKIPLLLIFFLAANAPGRANIYIVGETNAGTRAILFLNYNSYGGGTPLFDVSLTLRYKNGEVRTLQFKKSDPSDEEGRIEEAATQVSLKEGDLWQLTSAFAGTWGDAPLGGGRVEMAFSGPSNSQKGVEDIDRANSVNQMTIQWPDGSSWPQSKAGSLVFKKLKLYGWKGDDGYPEGYDEQYAEAMDSKAERLLKETIAGEDAADILFEDVVDSDYIVQHDKADGRLIVQSTRLARYGRIIQTITMADLNLDEAVIEMVDGGAFAGTALLTITVNKGKHVTTRSWPPDGKERLVDSEMSTGTETDIYIHFQDEEKANLALGKLKELSDLKE